MTKLVIASNRGPVQHALVDGHRVARRGAGGLVSALSSLPMLGVDGTWLCSAMSEEDRAVAREAGHTAIEVPNYAQGTLRVRMIEHDERAFESAHHGFSNSLLWFLQHQLWGWGSDPTIGPASYEAFDDYRTVNAAFAEAVIEELETDDGGPSTVMLHDYHLYLVAKLVREKVPDVLMQQFVHIPWPPADAWRVLPRVMVVEILEGLLGCDVVAFHTEHYARCFVETCEAYLGLPVDVQGRLLVSADGGPDGSDFRAVRVAWYPISVDVDTLSALTREGQTRVERDHLREHRREKLIVRVDRADPSKNIYRGFQAFELMLEHHPEWMGRVEFLALIQPSRSSLVVYADYLEQIESIAARINERFSTADWRPVNLIVGESMARAVAAYQEYDVLLVNPVADGLNLVAKEGVVVNEHDGVLVLSEPAGVFEEIGSFSLGVNPFDVLDQADALDRALRMPVEERHARAEACREVVLRNDLDRWLGEQLRHLAALRED